MQSEFGQLHARGWVKLPDARLSGALAGNFSGLIRDAQRTFLRITLGLVRRVVLPLRLLHGFSGMQPARRRRPSSVGQLPAL